MDDTKEFPKEYPEQFVNVLKDMTFGDDFELKGSASQTSSLYYGDYDAFEKVHRDGQLEDVLVGLRKDFQGMIMKLKSRRDVRIADIKAGECPEWRILPKEAGVKDGKVIGYNVADAHKRIAKLKKDKIINSKEAETAYRLTPSDMSLEGIVKAVGELKHHILRWTPADVLANKLVKHGKTFTLEYAFSSPNISKLDVIAFLQGTRFVEISAIYQFYNGKTLLNKGDTDVEKSLMESVIAYTAQGKYFKVLKRLASLARLHKESKVVEKFIPIFNSDLGRMNLVVNDINTLLYMFENYANLPETAIRFEIDQFINRLSNIYETPEFKYEAPKVFDDLHRALKLPISKMPKLLDKIARDLDSVVQKKAKPIVEALGGGDWALSHLSK